MEKITHVEIMTSGYDIECFAKKYSIGKDELEDFILDVINANIHNIERITNEDYVCPCCDGKEICDNCRDELDDMEVECPKCGHEFSVDFDG